MRRASLFLSLAAVVLLGFGCGSSTKEDKEPAPTSKDDKKDGTCENGQQLCNGMNLMQCRNGTWATETCEHVCQQIGLGEATGCMHDASKGFETCFCAPESDDACKEGEQKCSGLTLSVCQAGAWSTSACETLCQQSGLGEVQSCGYDADKGTEICFCGSAPPTCQTGEQKCVGTSLSICESGSWKTWTCDDLCHQGGLGMVQSCDYDPTKGKQLCLCYDGVIGDPCKASADCTQGVCGTGGWCSQTCSHDSECGKSSAGNTNYCMQTTSGSGACFPYCSTSSMCTDYPGTTCVQGVATKDGLQVDGVCSK